MSISKKIDFAVIFTVKNANPNGDPLNGNRPRQTYDGIGEVSDVCIKRKIRNRLMQMGESILIQSDDNKLDTCTSIRSRVDASGLKDADKDFSKNACVKWFDVRAFGQVFAFTARKKKGKKQDNEEEGAEGGDSVSIPVRGPVSIHPAFSLEKISITSTQITKSTNSEDNTKAGKKADDKTSDTIGMKHRVDQGTYVFYGSINYQLSTLTGFSDDDAKKLKEAFRTMFENDTSSARPDGSMAVKNLIWWTHSCEHGDVSSAKVHKSLKIEPNGNFTVDNIPYRKNEKECALQAEIIAGF